MEVERSETPVEVRSGKKNALRRVEELKWRRTRVEKLFDEHQSAEILN